MYITAQSKQKPKSHIVLYVVQLEAANELLSEEEVWYVLFEMAQVGPY